MSSRYSWAVLFPGAPATSTHQCCSQQTLLDSGTLGPSASAWRSHGRCQRHGALQRRVPAIQHSSVLARQAVANAHCTHQCRLGRAPARGALMA
eukprot:4074857-Alexandrium_andersonii.AAC.1